MPPASAPLPRTLPRTLPRAVAALVLACAVALGTAVAGAVPAQAKALDLHRGSRGAQVHVLESRLHRLHLLPASAVDRRYRRATVIAVKRLQHRHHLRATGRVDLHVWNLVAQAVRPVAVKPAPKPLPAPTGPPPAIVAHRGAVGPGAPENTLASMRRAADSAAVLEFDLRLTADHGIVLMHDSTLDRTTNCTGRVIDWTLQDLRQRCLVGDQPIPTFDEVAAYAGTLSLKIAPEIKNGDIDDADLAHVLDIIDAHGLRGRTIMQSFEPAVLQRVHAADPALRLMLVSTRPVTVAAARAVGATTVAIGLENLTAADVAAYRSNALTVWTFTAIDDATLDQAHRIHVDAVITDIAAEARAHYGG